MRSGSKIVAGVAVAVVLAASARWTLQAQERSRRGAMPKAEAEAARAAPASAQDALHRPYTFAFAEPTPLADACATIAKGLGFSVVLDRAALDRQEVSPDDEVRLEVRARLKVGLKLLLDPLGLTFRVEPEDNLLIVTDAEGSEDPAAQSLAELKAMHREIHDLQDAVDDLRDLVEEELGYEPEEPEHRTTIVGTRPALPPRRPRASHRDRRPYAKDGTAAHAARDRR